MKNFWGFYDNGKYKVGCNGQTIYIYNENGNELARFKDIPYAYRGIFKKDSNIFVAKSTAGKLAIYDLDRLQLIKKIHITSIGAQDEGIAFSHKGDLLYNIETHSAKTELAIYETTKFNKIKTILKDDKIVLDFLEIYEDDIFVLGFIRDDSGIFDYGFVSKLEEYQLTNIKRIKTNKYKTIAVFDDYQYIRSYKVYESMGFTKKSLEWDLMNSEHIIPVTLKQVFEEN